MSLADKRDLIFLFPHFKAHTMIAKGFAPVDFLRLFLFCLAPIMITFSKDVSRDLIFVLLADDREGLQLASKKSRKS